MKTTYVQYTPIPAQVPRQLAIEILQSHGEIITLNPLVLDYHPIKAPRDCPNDEYYSTWYEITERIQFVPGLKKIGSSKVTFKGCFHDMPWGVQTHMYVPMGVNLRNKWQIKGSQPGEPPEPRELGSGAPTSGLYLKEEVDIKCNALALSFVKKEMKQAAQVMVTRMIKKAELLDAGVLQAMFENGKLKTINPADRSQTMASVVAPVSPNPMSPGVAGRWRPDSYHDPSQRISTYSQNSSSGYQGYQGFQPPNHVPNQYGQVQHPDGRGLAVEMPGDYLYPTPPPTQSTNMSDRMSQVSGSDRSPINNTNRRWSHVSSDRHSDAGTSTTQGISPNPEIKQFTAELQGSSAKALEAQQNSTSLPPPIQQHPAYAHQTYNPQNYARFAGNGYA